MNLTLLTNRLKAPAKLLAWGTRTLALVVCFLYGQMPARLEGAPQKPNVLVIITDDQGYGDVGAHGNQMIQTPHLDRLHEQSVRLTQFHVDPTCSPTRSALMTGRYSTRTGVWHTILGRSILYRDETTLADLFRAGGYRTGMFGKWHLGDNYPYRPTDRGFDVAVHHGGGGVTQTPDAWGNDYFDDTYFRNNQKERFEGYCTDVFFKEAMDFIGTPSEKPFFCYLSTNAPHGPFLVAESYKKPYLEKAVSEPMASFYGMITNIDENLGRLRTFLEANGLSENTLLIFMTDNGTAAGLSRPKANETQSAKWKGFNDGMRGTKGSAYDGGHRVPSFWYWPQGELGNPRDMDSLTAHIDLLPTLADICHLDTTTTQPLDGISLLPWLQNRPNTFPDRTLFVHSQRIEYPRKWKTASVMTDRWRLIDGKELYDIREDPGQERDLSVSHPETVHRLRTAYDDWWASLKPRFDSHPFIVIGSPKANPTTITAHDWHGSSVPWNQRMIRNMPAANGYWMVECEHTGWYRFTLRHWPAEEPKEIVATEARLRIADVDQTIVVNEPTQQVRFTVYLKEGTTQLETWLTDSKNQETRGAFFIDVEAL